MGDTNHIAETSDGITIWEEDGRAFVCLTKEQNIDEERISAVCAEHGFRLAKDGGRDGWQVDAYGQGWCAIGSTEHLQEIADILNREITDTTIDRCTYNHWDRFEELCAERGIEVDDARQEREDPIAAHELFAADGWSLVLSAEWSVNVD